MTLDISTAHGRGQQAGTRKAAAGCRSPWGLRLAIVLACLVPAVASAGITALEHFDAATAGDVVGQGSSDSGWASVWAAGPASLVTATASATTVEFTPLGANKVGGGMAVNIAGSASGVSATRQLTSARTGTFYVGCLMKFTGTLNTDDIFTVGMTNSASDTANGFNFGFRGVLTGAAHHFFIRRGTATLTGGPLMSASGTTTATRYLVLKVEKTAAGNYDKVTGWINPDTMSMANNPNGDMQLLEDTGISSLSHVILRASGVDAGDSCGIDHLVLGTTFADIVPPWFGIFPLYGVYSGSAGSLTEAQALAAVGDLKTQIGENRGQFRVGFGGIFGGESTLDRNCRLARDNNLSHSVIIGTQTHALPSSIANIAAADFRNYQWRKNGSTWEGVTTTDNRDWQVVTPSRYATTLRAKFEDIVRNDKAKPIKRQMDAYPGIIVNVNAVIEEELAIGAGNSNYIGDYSPYAITEFRDWLRHTGIYDADTGTYPTEGAPAAIVGTLVMISGKLRSPFYDDPTPGNANGTGATFNATFGTTFTTWTMKNWDLTAYPSAITDTAFDPTPASGTGYTAGGFDAPRTVSATNAFWKAWSWDWQDQGSTYPSGNPSAPAFGFRQVMVRNFVNDVLAWIQAEGIPASMITAHQIPGEMLSSTNRALSAATPIWTGLSKYNSTVGITRYGTFSTTTLGYLKQYTDFWSVHEWHPRSGETDDAVLRTYAMNEIEKMFNNKCRLVQPFSWTGSATYPVKNSGIAVGLKEWMDAKLVTQTPTITAIANQSVNTNTPTAALPFTVADDVIPAGSVLVTAASSNTTLVPNANIAFSGTGATRSVTVTPASGQTGTATITLTASDGSLTSTSAFVLSVGVGQNQAPTITAISDQAVPENTPTAALAFTIGDDTTPVGSLTVTRSSSNTTLIPTANLVLGGSGANRTLTLTPANNQIGTAIITVQVSDGSLTTSTNFTITVSRTLVSHASDASVKDDTVVVDQTNTITLLGAGGSSPYVDRCTVYVFQLPDLGPIANPFSSSSFTFNYSAKQGTLTNNDLYGLGRRDASTVLPADYYGQTTTADPTDATRLQTDILTNTTAIGLIDTSSGGNAALLGYLNAQYASGVGIGKYVFLRLNTSAPKTAINRATLTMSEGAVTGPPDTRPRITYIANTPPTISDITNKTLNVNESSSAIAFTIGDSQTAAASLTLSKSSSNPTLLPTSGIVFGGSGANRTVTLTPAANQLGTSTVTVTVNDGALSVSDTFVLTVTGSASETWRFTHFGTTADTGTAADAFDSNNDGENNLLEYATGQIPGAATLTATPVTRNGNNIEFIYTRSNAASAEGLNFLVEWTDTLVEDSWSNAGVTEQLLTDNGTVQTIKATLPIGTSGPLFVHLHVQRP